VIRCNLSRLLGERKLKISEVERVTGLHRHKITALYKETALKVDLDTIDKLCEFLDCSVGELFERVVSDE
jgi:putative transcriptional regulator